MHVSGRHSYHYRANYLPIGMRCNTRSMYDIVLPGGLPHGPISVNSVHAPDSNILPLSCRDNVFVCGFYTLLYAHNSKISHRYMFAILLGGCHLVMRSRPMRLVKDPQNHNMHPRPIAKGVAKEAPVLKIFTTPLGRVYLFKVSRTVP